MTECHRCGGKAHNAFLCSPCQTHLRKLLTEMPWWLSRLTETAIGQTKMSDNSGRKSAARKDLDGDKDLAACIETLPPNRDDDLEQARKAREKAALAHALATGGINARASELLAQIADSLGYWCRVLCEARGITYTPTGSSRSFGANHAKWLRINLNAISASEEAGDILGEIETALEDIVQIVNRPVRWWDLGQCSGIDRKTDEECGVGLRVPAETDEVQCRRCGTRHNVHRLLLARKYEAEGQPMNRRKLVRYNRDLPAEFQVPERTLRVWLERGALAPCGADPEGDPLYSWIDVRLLMLDSKHASVTRRVP